MEEIKKSTGEYVLLDDQNQEYQEDKSKRTQNGKIYNLGNQHYTQISQIGSRHYKTKNDPNYPWLDIDLTIEPCNIFEFEYWCHKNNFTAYFNDVTDVTNFDLASFEIKNSQGITRWINYKLVNATPDKVEINENRIKYINCYPGIDVEYIITDSKLKENITVRNYASYKDIEFSIKLDGSTYSKAENGDIVFTDIDTREELYRIVAPYAWDSTYDETAGQEYIFGNAEFEFGKVEYKGAIYDSIKIVADSNWLQNAVYPVVIDPTTTYQISNYLDNGNGYSDNSFTNTASTFNIGRYYGYNCFLFLRFTNIIIPRGNIINSAKLQVKSNSTLSTDCSNIIRIRTENVDNATSPTSMPIINTPTIASVNWNPESWSGASWYDSPDIKTIIQEVINRSGWVSGNSIRIDIDNYNSPDIQAYRAIANYTNNPVGSGAKLVIDYSSNVSATGVTIDKSTVTLNVNQTDQLTATISPADATNKTVTWSSNVPSVATVSSTGLVTAVSAGTATITVTTQDGGFTATCSVTVNSANVDKSSSDSIILTISETSENSANSSSTDATTVTINEVSSLNVDISSNDNISIIILETSSLEINMDISTSDNITLTIDDSSILEATASGTDPPTIVIDETVDLQTDLLTVDENNLTIDEIAQIDINIQTTDDIDLILTETIDINADIGSSDDINIVVDELSNTDIDVNSVDDNTITIIEQSTDKELSSSDDIQLTIDEKLDINIDINSLDNVNLTIDENSIIDIDLFTTDDFNITVDEQIIDREIFIDDNATLTTIESNDLYVDNDLTDTINLTIDEITGVSIEVVELNAIDSFQIAFAEGINVDVTIGSNEAISLKLNEQSVVDTDTISSDDVILIIAEESIEDINIQINDDINIDVSESNNIDNDITTLDSLGITTIENSATTNDISCNDNSSISINEQSSADKGIYIADDFVVSIDEISSVTIDAMDLNSSDEDNLFIVENTGIDVDLVSTDSINVYIVEQVNDREIVLFDDTNLVFIENSLEQVDNTAYDSFRIDANEQAEVDVSVVELSSSDVFTVGITEVSIINIDTGAVDNINVLATEQFNINNDINTSDDINITINEISSLDISDSRSAEDSVDIDIVEDATVDVIIESTDTSVLGCNEVSIVGYNIIGNDIINLNIIDSYDISTDNVSSDDINIGITESGKYEELTGQLFVCKVGYKFRKITLDKTERTINLKIKQRNIKLGMMKMPLIGDTIRLTAEFQGWDGSCADPSNITLKIYDEVQRQIGDTVNITDANKTATGKYYYDYIVPDGKRNLVYEFCGTLENKPILSRGVITREWLKRG